MHSVSCFPFNLDICGFVIFHIQYKENLVNISRIYYAFLLHFFPVLHTKINQLKSILKYRVVRKEGVRDRMIEGGKKRGKKKR